VMMALLRIKKSILDQGFDILTYRKGRCRKVPKRLFSEMVAIIEGRKVSYTLSDQEVRFLKGQLSLRQVTRLRENGHQTMVLTSRRDLTAAEVLYRMFDRWRQENFFKYMDEEMELDALLDYRTEADDPNRSVPNPERLMLDGELAKLRVELETLQAQVGFAALTNEEGKRPTMRGFKIANASLSREIEQMLSKYNKLKTRRNKMPKRVPVGQTVQEEVIKLAPEAKHLTDLLKMLAYQVESELFGQVTPHYARAEDEGRTLIQTALNASANIEVDETELRITLMPLSSPHRTQAIQKLCEELNQANCLFPGTNLHLRYTIQTTPEPTH
jgi:hypothetical protein